MQLLILCLLDPPTYHRGNNHKRDLLPVLPSQCAHANNTAMVLHGKTSSLPPRRTHFISSNILLSPSTQPLKRSPAHLPCSLNVNSSPQTPPAHPLPLASTPVFLFSKFIYLFFGYFDPVNILSDNKNK